MGCTCGKAKKTAFATEPEVDSFETTELSGVNTLVAARSPVLLIVGNREISLKSGHMAYIPRAAANELIAQGAPVWRP